ncbi:MAG: phosphatidate cytidylyltransferase [Chitinivibrionales bacterium]
MTAAAAVQLPVVLLYAVGALACGSVLRFIALRKTDPDIRKKRLASLLTWWVLTLVVAGAVSLGKAGVCALFFAISCIAIREYAGIVMPGSAVRSTAWTLYMLAAVNYLFILFDKTREFFVFFPISVLMVLATVNLLKGNPREYVRSTAGMFFGAVTLVYGLSHTALLFSLPGLPVGPAGVAGWFLYLLILTEINDITQALVGRRFGAHSRHRITPAISPNKTWEGFLGGALVTTVLAFVLHPWFTAFGTQRFSFTGDESLLSVAAGLLISLSGFFGDINMSAIKRDAGVKDSGKLLPGMGGLIDRIDSLTFTGPAFVYFLILVQGKGGLW